MRRCGLADYKSYKVRTNIKRNENIYYLKVEWLKLALATKSSVSFVARKQCHAECPANLIGSGLSCSVRLDVSGENEQEHHYSVTWSTHKIISFTRDKIQLKYLDVFPSVKYLYKIFRSQ